METLTLTLNKAKETKNKVVYGTADGTVIQSRLHRQGRPRKGAAGKGQGRDLGGVASSANRTPKAL